jgi:hypothetical protein
MRRVGMRVSMSNSRAASFPVSAIDSDQRPIGTRGRQWGIEVAEFGGEN